MNDIEKLDKELHGQPASDMTLRELQEAVSAEAARRDPDHPYYTLRIEISQQRYKPPEIKYICYMIPHHMHFDEFPTPEALLASLRGQRLDTLIDGKLPVSEGASDG